MFNFRAHKSPINPMSHSQNHDSIAPGLESLDAELRAESNLIQVDLPPFHFWAMVGYGLLWGVLMVIALGLAIAIASWSLNLGGALLRMPVWGTGMLVGTAIGLPFYLFQRYARTRAQRRVVQLIEATPNKPIGAIIDECIKPIFSRGVLGTTSIQGTIRGLSLMGKGNVTVHACRSKFMTPIHGIDIPIEPLPLDQTVPFISMLGDSEEFQADASASNLKPTTHEDERSLTKTDADFRRRLSRTVTLLGGWWVYGVFLAMWAIYAIKALITWQFDWMFVVWTATILIYSSGISAGGAWRPRQQWLIVPSGLVSRMANWRGAWSLHLFTRENSILVTSRVATNQVLVCVGDIDSYQWAIVTPTESRALLRAWLSPLPPPSFEQLQELAG